MYNQLYVSVSVNMYNQLYVSVSFNTYSLIIQLLNETSNAHLSQNYHKTTLTYY